MGYFNTTCIYKDVGRLHSYFKKTYTWQLKFDGKWINMYDDQQEQLRSAFPNGANHKYPVGKTFQIRLSRTKSYTMYIGKPHVTLRAGQRSGCNCYNAYEFNTGFYQIADQNGELDSKWISPIRCLETECPA